MHVLLSQMSTTTYTTATNAAAFLLVLQKMLKNSLLLFCLLSAAFAKEAPDVDCVVLHLESVKCTWNRNGNPTVNYTFSSWFYDEEARACETYLSNRSVNYGCIRPYGNILNRFNTFYMQLAHANDTFIKTDELKNKVKLNPPRNLTAQKGGDRNLWFYWNQTSAKCVQSQIRYRTEYKKWNTYAVNVGEQNYCVNLPSSRSRYELQARSRLVEACGASGWSDWSEPVTWGSDKSAESQQGHASTFVSIIAYTLAPVLLLLMVVVLLRCERFRVIFVGVVPEQSLIPEDVELWLQIPKGLKEGLKPNYHERPCPVRE
ncbi:cytokine receptor common subunit gamma-like [Festucalex cinctus]